MENVQQVLIRTKMVTASQSMTDVQRVTIVMKMMKQDDVYLTMCLARLVTYEILAFQHVVQSLSCVKTIQNYEDVKREIKDQAMRTTTIGISL